MMEVYRMRKLGTWLVVMVTVLMLVAGCAGQQKTEQPKAEEKPAEQLIELTLAHSATPDNSLAIAYQKFADLVWQKTNGKVKITVHGSGVLGSDQDLVNACKLGTIDIGSCASNNMGPFTDAYLFADLPYIFDSIDSSHKVWWGPIGEELKQKVEKDMGVKVVMYLDTGGGFRVLANNKRPVKVPADLQGMKLRATASPVEIALLKAWGASPTPIQWAEVYNALEQKVVDGEHLHYVWIYNARHFEALKYLTEVGAMCNVHVCVMSPKAWDKLGQYQSAFLEAARETEKYCAQVDAGKGKECKQKLLAAGLEVYTPTAQELAQWRELGKSVWDQFKDKIPAELVSRVVEAQKK